jgi:RNA polymerase sigma-70 factor (ECF subfamily)
MFEHQKDEDALRVERWVVAAQQGDRDAFGALFRHFEKRIFAAALARLGDFAEAEELCQDVFIQALLKLDQLRDPACFGGWLHAIGHRMAVNRVTRRRPNGVAAPEALEGAQAECDTPLEDVLTSERCEQVRDGLEQLGDLDRQTLEAFYVEGRTLTEMSDQFDAPLGTIKRRLHVARKRLAKQVEPLVAV